jgi:Asp-tRNA(Asn)/Glu-tRNA(Gln) amidotransferase A subunit family amidase
MKITDKEIQQIVTGKAVMIDLQNPLKKDEINFVLDKILPLISSKISQFSGKTINLAKAGYVILSSWRKHDDTKNKLIKYDVSDVYAYFKEQEQVKKTNTSLPKIYISGKISGIEDTAPQLFQEAEDMLLAAGYEVVNPMKLPHNHDKSWGAYMKEDIEAIRDNCTHIYMLKNWRESRGARIEINEAMDLGLTIIFEK